jgi:menaquinone-9 beta-reductase
MTSPIGIEIVGGGLAGLSLGLALRREHVPVRILEAGAYPRHRVCGEFITGLGAGTIDRLGLHPFLADARRHHEVAWFIGEQFARAQRLPAPALGLSRHTLDARLARAFVAAGGDLQCRMRVTSRSRAAGRVFATGRKVGRSSWIGLKVHVEGLMLQSDLELHLGENAYIGLTGIEGDRVNVCGLFRRRDATGRGAALLPAYLRSAGLGNLAARLERAVLCPASFSAVAALEFTRRIGPSDCLQIGDACAMIPPFTGNGMAMAFQSAELALEPLVSFAQGRAGWPATCDAIRTALRRCFRMRLASAGALHPFLLQPARQRLVAFLGRAGLLPFGPFYATLH